MARQTAWPVTAACYRPTWTSTISLCRKSDRERVMELTGMTILAVKGVTNNDADKFKFRTPSLRNVELTGPYGHDGAYPTLETVIQHHLNPIKGLNNYNTKQAVLPSRPDLDQFDFVVQNDPQ